MKMMATKSNKSKAGFTLVEVIAVLVILGILAAVAIPKYIDLQQNAKMRALHAGVAELNGREALTWGNSMLSTAGYTTDAALSVDRELGDDYDESGLPAASGAGTLIFQTESMAVSRITSTATNPAVWSVVAP
jgi:prepilin-type N-terminal cleavage/methylation domain-containing protein